MDIKKAFGKRLRAIREAHDLTREALASASGMSPVNIAKLESGERFVSADSLEALAKALKTKPHEFFVTEGVTKRVNAREQIELLLEGQDEKALKLIKDVAARILRDL